MRSIRSEQSLKSYFKTPTNKFKYKHEFKESMKRSFSYENIGGERLLKTLKLTAKQILMKQNVLSYSSAMTSPNNPCVIYKIKNKESFNISEAAKLIVKYKIHGIFVFNETLNKYVGCVELMQLINLLANDNNIISSSPKHDLWYKYFNNKKLSEELYNNIISNDLTQVHIITEKDSLYEACQKLSQPNVHRVLILNKNKTEALAVITEKDILSYFKKNSHCLTFVDGSEIPVLAHEPDIGDSNINFRKVRVTPDDAFRDALIKLVSCNIYSIPVVNDKGILMNTFTLTDVKEFFCTPKDNKWSTKLSIFLNTCSTKRRSKFNDLLYAATLGVPLTRVIECLHIDKTHTIWITDHKGRPIGEISIKDIFIYAVADTIPKATRRNKNTNNEIKSTMKRIKSIPQLSKLNKNITDLNNENSDDFKSTENSFDSSTESSELDAMSQLKEIQKNHEKDFIPFERNLRWIESSKKGVKNEVVMITYPNCFGKNLKGLKHVLDNYLKGIVGGIHILPFFPSSADRGFAPLTYKEVDPNFGNWDDIKELTKDYNVCCDFMVNHISQESQQFKDFKKNRENSKWKDLFISSGEPTSSDLSKIYTRKPRAPYFEIEFEDGLEPKKEKVWCTFSLQQIDIDVTSKVGKEFIKDQLLYLCKQGIKFIRLDAFGYATKKLDTNCFMIEPDVWNILNEIYDIVKPYNVELLAEIHEHYTIQLKLSKQGKVENQYWVYDFALPMLLLQALYDSSTHNLHHWLSICPHNQFTTLDTHDGIGVVDVKDLMTKQESDRTSENLYKYGANVKRIYSSSNYDNLDIYQINCTYYSALGNNDDWYLLARAIQLFSPGIPQIYYVGLFAGINDIKLVETTKVGRDINRHNYTLNEIKEEIKRPVVRKLFKLCKFRNTYPAFNGNFTMSNLDKNELYKISLFWTYNKYQAQLWANFKNKTFDIYYINIDTNERLKLNMNSY